MANPIDKANILVDALPYIKEFHGKTVVIKYGGHAMLNEELQKAVINDVILMKLVGINPVIIHGGGPEINRLLKRLDIQSEFINGLRVTDGDTMEVVEMVLVGKLNKGIVTHINQNGGKAIGLSGKDGNLLLAEKKTTSALNAEGEKTELDLGFVGEIVSVSTEPLDMLIERDYIPVVSPIGIGTAGESYNINADYAAAEIAVALGAEKLIILTDVEGICVDKDDPSTLISSLRLDEVDNLIERKIISGGMIPKVDCCVNAIKGGVKSAHILDGRRPHSILLEMLTKDGIGTMVAE